MAAWTFIAQRAVTREFLDWDLPIRLREMSWELSGPGSFRGTLSPDVGALRSEDGRLLLEEWGTFLYVEKDDLIRWGGIVTKSSFAGDTWEIEAAGFTTYPSGLPYLGDYSRIGVDPTDAVKEIWRHLQSYPEGDLGLSVIAAPTPTRLGTPATPAAEADKANAAKDISARLESGAAIFEDWSWKGNPSYVADWNDELSKEYGGAWNNIPAATAWLDAYVKAHPIEEAEPYLLAWYEAPDCGSEINDLATSTPFDYTERHYWRDASREEVVHEVETYYPRIGRRREDLAFVQGDNVTNVASFESTGDDYANEVMGLGAGEGSAALRRSTASRDGRLRRARVYSDKAVNSADRMDALIKDELERRRGLLQVTSIDVEDHDNARLGAWSVGDDILVRTSVPWLGDVDIWCRITSWALTGDHTATLTLARSDSFRYGG